MKKLIYILLFISVNLYSQVQDSEGNIWLIQVRETDPLSTRTQRFLDSIANVKLITQQKVDSLGIDIYNVFGDIDSIRIANDTTYFYVSGTIVMKGILNPDSGSSDLTGYVQFTDTTSVIATKYDTIGLNRTIDSLHNHGNKTILDNTTASFTTTISNAVTANTGKDTTGIHHSNRSVLDGISAGDTSRYATDNYNQILSGIDENDTTRWGSYTGSIASEISANDTTRYATDNYNSVLSGVTTADTTRWVTTFIGVAISDETTALTVGTAKATFRMPYAMYVTDVKASVTTAPAGSTIQIDINESGSSILSTVISIDASEKTSTTAATAAVISDANLANDAEITIDIDQVGSGTSGAGAKVYLIGRILQ